MEGLPKEILSAVLKSGESTREKARKMPNAANLMQYPKEFNNSVPVITAKPLEERQLPTIIIGTQSSGYPKESFETDVIETVKFFNLPEGSYQTILLKPVAEDLEEILDSADATKQMHQVVREINKLTVKEIKTTVYSESTPLTTGDIRHGRLVKEEIVTTFDTYTLRIVSVGIATANFLFVALEYILNHWSVPKKNVQFVTKGETKNDKFINFWITACINDLVQHVQFVNLSCYLPFGYYKAKGKGSKLLKTGRLSLDATVIEPPTSNALCESP